MADDWLAGFVDSSTMQSVQFTENIEQCVASLH